MRKIFLFLTIIIPVYILISLYFLDKVYFLCPIEYKRDIIIRCDKMGEGFFSAKRNGNRAHNGIDLLAEIGTPVKACRSGVVTVAANQINGMGNYVVIQHPYNIKTLYGHLSKIFVSKNQPVRQGQVIGLTGNTGNANSSSILPHLHFEVRNNGVLEDPWEYLQ